MLYALDEPNLIFVQYVKAYIEEETMLLCDKETTIQFVVDGFFYQDGRFDQWSIKLYI